MACFLVGEQFSVGESRLVCGFLVAIEDVFRGRVKALIVSMG